MMSTVGMMQPGRRRRHSKHSHPVVPAESWLTTLLTRSADGVLVALLFGVPACFAGRTPQGQLLFAGLAGLLALCWALRQLVAATPFWNSTPAVWLLGLGALLAGFQVVPLSQAWLDRFSPETFRLLTLWGADRPSLFPQPWSTVSLNPAETTSGLATFLCYALLFCVVIQRIQIRDDIGWCLKIIVGSAAAMAIFGLLQYFFSNGLFFWVYEHPTVSTTETVLGTFTNRNHFAQFLAIAVGPALWWLSQAAEPPARPAATDFGGQQPSGHSLTIFLLGGALGCMLLAGLLSLSRAGTVAIVISSLTSLILLSRRGHLPAKIVPMVLLIGAVVGIGAVATNYRSLADRFDQMIPDERTTIWAANFRLACRFPWFGTGVGTHLYTHQLETDRIDDNVQFTHAESGYLQIASECGFVGLLLAVVMIGVCWRWCLRAYRTTAGPESTAMAAAILASLVANLLHAGVDFFWYAPGCMVPMTVLTACACRLSQMMGDGPETVVLPHRVPRLFWATSVCGLTALSAWMISAKLPAAIAEPHRVEYLILQKHGEDLVDESEDLERMKMSHLIAAARANPRDCRAQLRAAAGYLHLFGLKQEASENPLSLDQLRDAALASEFPSAKALNDWLAAAVGSNRKYLKAAHHYARRALLLCPLEGQGYLYLSQLEFLRDPECRLEEPLRSQALAVRPFDAAIDFEIGRAASWKNDSETAMHHWRKAFQRSPSYQRNIAAALAGNYSAAELLEQLSPDRPGLYALVAAYKETGKEDDLKLIRHRYAQACLDEAPRLTGSAAEYAWTEAVRMSCDGDEPVQAIRTAQIALEHLSQSLELHKTLGVLLLKQEDFAGAAKHLHWAALRAPDDAGLKQLAAQAVKEKIRHQRTAEGVTPAGHQSFR